MQSTTMPNRNAHSGAYGEVRISRKQRTATKKARLFDDGYLNACNLREALFMRRLVDSPLPHVVRVLSVGLDVASASVVSVMEMGDSTLHDLVHMLPFSTRMKELPDVFRHVLLGACAMHDAGVAHGDIKPNNIVRVTDPVTRDQEYKLVDFGGVCWYKTSPRHDSLCTYVTRAPELLLDAEDVVTCPLTDAWSVGATMYFYCTRRYLVDDARCPDNPEDSEARRKNIFEQHEAGLSIKFPRGVPKEVRGVIRAMLAHDPAKRLTCKECLAKHFGVQVGPEGMQYGPTFDSPAFPAWDGDHAGVRTRAVSMLEESGETDCLPVIAWYLRAATSIHTTPTQLHTLLSASYFLARAIVYDEDTPLAAMDVASRDAVLAVLRGSDLRMPCDASFFEARERPVIVSIDGNIGCSKSTVLEQIREALGPDCSHVGVFVEPVAEWARLLEMFYADPSRWCLALHVQVITSFFDAVASQLQTKRVLLMERSAWSCVHVFQDMMYRSGALTMCENDVVTRLFSSLAANLVPDMVVYLQCDPAVCEQRLRDRDRACEKLVDRAYLERLHCKYEEVMSMDWSRLGIKDICRVDTSRSSKQEVLDGVAACIRRFVSI